MKALVPPIRSRASTADPPSSNSDLRRSSMQRADKLQVPTLNSPLTSRRPSTRLEPSLLPTIGTHFGPRSASILQELGQLRSQNSQEFGEAKDFKTKNSLNLSMSPCNSSGSSVSSLPQVGSTDFSGSLISARRQIGTFKQNSHEYSENSGISTPGSSSPSGFRKKIPLGPISGSGRDTPSTPSSPQFIKRRVSNNSLVFNPISRNSSSDRLVSTPDSSDQSHNAILDSGPQFQLKDFVVLNEFYRRGPPDDNTDNTDFVVSIRVTTLASVPVLRRKPYAMKVYNKQQLAMLGLLDSVANEGEILDKIKGQFVTRLFTTFQDLERIYFVFEWLPANLASVLENRVGEEDTRVYMGELILGIESLHTEGIIHRDIQPSNIMLDKKGHLRIGDFASAVVLDSEITNSLCPEISSYMAPEVVSGKSHSFTCDYFSFGLILYQFLSFTPAFKQLASSEDLARKIIYKLPQSNFTEPAKSFLKGLLELDSTVRLGSKGCLEVKQHTWFGGRTMSKWWRDLENGEVDSPALKIVEDKRDVELRSQIATEDEEILKWRLTPLEDPFF